MIREIDFAIEETTTLVVEGPGGECYVDLVFGRQVSEDDLVELLGNFFHRKG